MKFSKSALIVVIGLSFISLILPSRVLSIPVPHESYGDPVDNGLLNASVTYGSGIDASTGPWEPDDGWNNSNTSLTWNITYNENGSWTYEYHWVTASKELSNIIIELTEGTTISVDQINIPDPDPYDLNLPGYEVGYFSEDPEKLKYQGMPYEIYGVKVSPGSDTIDYTFGFTVPHAPVWGNFYAIDGSKKDKDTKEEFYIYAYNTGFADSEGGVFIARPDGVPSGVPEPATLLLLGLGMIVLGLLIQKKFKSTTDKE